MENKTEQVQLVLETLAQYREADIASKELEAQIKALQDQKKNFDIVVKTTKESATAILKEMNYPKLVLNEWQVSFIKSSYLEVSDDSQIPAEFWEQVPKRLDNKIKEAIKKGAEIEGAQILERQNIQIKYEA